MRILPNSEPPARLLSSAITFQPVLAQPEPRRIFARVRRFIAKLVGLILAAGAAAIVLTRSGILGAHPAADRGFITVSHAPLPPAGGPSAAETNQSAPIVVDLRPELFRVTAIALGHPRLAVINGQQVAEGDRLVVHTPTAAVSVQLRVLRIADGEIQLSDGTRVITVPLLRPPTRSARKP